MTDSNSSSTGTDAAPSSEQASRISRLFDIRLIVGGLLTIYGIVLLIKSFTASSADYRKAAGLHLNLWTGVGMLVVGLAMLLWMKLNPLAPLKPDDLVEDSGPKGSLASGNSGDSAASGE